jgi:hypothetical protein
MALDNRRFWKVLRISSYATCALAFEAQVDCENLPFSPLSHRHLICHGSLVFSAWLSSEARASAALNNKASL